MKALFITTKSNDCDNHVQAWESVHGPAARLVFDVQGIRNDWQFAAAAEQHKPEVIFYIGACNAPGNPRPATLAGLRSFAPTINLCSDAADKPWHPVLAGMRTRGCFDLQVSIDGARNSPVDMATLTPVDPRPFQVETERDIRCGFSGSVGRWNERSEVVKALEWLGGLTVRERQGSGAYEDHARFLRRCRMLLNSSFTGTGHAHHVKGRVLEAGWAGCALLESEGSTIGDWFPADCYLTYRDPKEAAEIIASLDDSTISRMATRLSEEVRSRFHPSMIYGSILKRALDPEREKITACG